jgi:methionine-gamma-lyase
MDIESLCVRELEDTEFNPPHIQPVYLSSSYKFNSLQEGIEIFDNTKKGDVYSRYGHPNHRSIARKIAQLESGHEDEDCYALVTNSGMSAIHTLISGLCASGDTILASFDLYGGTTDLMENNLKRYGIQTRLIPFHDLNVVESRMEDLKPKLIFLESPSNPLLHCYDIKEISQIAKQHNCLTVIDNTFSTALIQRPLELGADYVLYSTTKYLNGHGNALGGAIVSKEKSMIEGELLKSMRLNGSTISPFDAWLLEQGIKTLPLRLEKQQNNAVALANLLTDHDLIEKVYYPGLKSHSSYNIAKKQMNGFGAMLSFELKVDAFTFMQNLSLISLAPTLGDINSLVLHPGSMSHRNMPMTTREKLGINEKLIRMSVGIESVNDLKADIINALKGS